MSSRLKERQWRRKWVVVYISRPQAHTGLMQACKLCLNLWWCKWLKPKRNLASNFKPYGLFISKTLFATGLANFKMDNLKTSKESLLLISGSSLFHSVIVEEKKNFWKTYSWFWYWIYRFDCFEENKTSSCPELNYTNKEVIYSYIFCRISKVSKAIFWILVTLRLTLDKAFW